MNFNSLLIVVGGTFAATMVNLPIKAVSNVFNILKNVFKGEDYDYGGVIDEIVQKATKARKDGLLSFESDITLQKLVNRAVDKYIEDSEFRSEINEYTQLEVSGSQF